MTTQGSLEGIRQLADNLSARDYDAGYLRAALRDIRNRIDTEISARAQAVPLAKEVVEAITAKIDRLYHAGDFHNGVTQGRGHPDEGDVLAGGLYDEIRTDLRTLISAAQLSNGARGAGG